MIRWPNPIVFLACLAPLGGLAWKAYSGNLGANPIEVITHSTGDWTLIFLLVTLSVTPLRKLTGHLWLIRFRRMFGLYHFLLFALIRELRMRITFELHYFFPADLSGPHKDLL
jgi:methionine sulfoxide reductase heme-binding subunit